MIKYFLFECIFIESLKVLLMIHELRGFLASMNNKMNFEHQLIDGSSSNFYIFQIMILKHY